MAIWDALVEGAKATYANAKTAVNQAADPNQMAPETKAVMDNVTKVTDGAINAAKDLFAKLGVQQESAESVPTPSSARLAADALSKARVSSIAEMTKNGSPAANTGSTTYWRDKFGKGAQIAAENTASPQGALPPG